MTFATSWGNVVGDVGLFSYRHGVRSVELVLSKVIYITLHIFSFVIPSSEGLRTLLMTASVYMVITYGIKWINRVKLPILLVVS